MGPGEAGRVEYADNWCGYDSIAAGQWTSVAASWTQPAPLANSSATYEWAAFWVGIDGAINSTVEQTGVDAYTADGIVGYEAWYEMYPADPVVIPVTVHGGDEITAAVTTDDAGSYTLMLTNDTTAVSYSTTQAGPTWPESAEVIAEDPGPLGTPVPLADFGAVQFTGCTFNGQPLGALSDDEWRMQSNGGVLEAAPSLISDDSSTGSSSFSVYTARNFAAPSSPTPVIGGAVVPPDAPWELLDCSATPAGIPIPDLSYQWLRDGVDLNGTSDPQHVTENADFGHTLSCQVTATNVMGTATGSASLFVPAIAPSNTAPPTVSGMAAVGKTLSCSGGSWKGAPTPSFTCQWLRDGVPIAGATELTYTVQSADAGHSLVCEVTATNSAGTTTATSAAVSVAASPPADTTKPTLSGTAAVGSSLSCSPGTWTGEPTPTLTYQWLRDDTPISEATQSGYTVHVADCGEKLACRVTATNSAGAAAATTDSLTVAAPALMLKAAATQVRLGKAITLSGSIRNFVAGDRVVGVYRKVAAKLTLLKSLSISSSGVYRWSLKPRKPGKWVFVARYRVSGRTFASKAVTVTVQR